MRLKVFFLKNVFNENVFNENVFSRCGFKRIKSEMFLLKTQPNDFLIL